MSKSSALPPVPTIDDLALLGVPGNVAAAIQTYLIRLNDCNADHSEARGYKFGGKFDGRYRTSVYVIDPKQTSAGKYLRVYALDVHEGVISERGGSIHAFIEKATGNVAKPAGLNAPAKSTAAATKGQVMWRFSLLDPTWPDFDPHGGYLYKR